jgi:hypothetical protein
MDYIPCRKRTFPLELAPEYVRCFKSYAQWLRHILERLGRDATLQVWRHAFEDGEDKLLRESLSTGWEDSEEAGTDVEAQITDILSAQFPPPIQGVTAQEARKLIEDSTPFRQIMRRLSSLHVSKEISTYEKLHLFRGGLSMLAESLIDLHGKQGEYIAYDAMLYPIIWECRPQMDAAEFLGTFRAKPTPSTMHGAGLEIDIIHPSDDEVLIHVRECEWARYYRERHPRVGYLMACSMDYASNRAINPQVRTQRTMTLMEGGELCDFRIYIVEEPSNAGEQHDP